MNPPPVTVATYWDPVEARLAQLHLQSAGIFAVLQNENSVSMNWLEFANASKGVQVQVDEADVSAAIDVLESQTTHGAEIGDEWRLASEEETDKDAREQARRQESADDSDVPLNSREQLVERAYKTAMIGLIFLPLEFYATYLLGMSLLSDEPLRPAAWRAARRAWTINGLVLLVCFGLTIEFGG